MPTSRASGMPCVHLLTEPRLAEELGAATALLQTDLPAWRYWVDQYYRLLQGGRVARAMYAAGGD